MHRPTSSFSQTQTTQGSITTSTSTVSTSTTMPTSPSTNRSPLSSSISGTTTANHHQTPTQSQNQHPVSTTSTPTRVRSYSPSVSASPKLKSFDASSVKPMIRPMLIQHLQNIDWHRDKGERTAAVCRELASEIKTLMVNGAPEGYKFSVCVQASQNCGQTTRADIACHWDDSSDVVLHEAYSTSSVVCTVVALCIRVGY